MKVRELIEYLKRFDKNNEIFWWDVGQDSGDMRPFEEELIEGETKRFIIKPTEKKTKENRK